MSYVSLLDHFKRAEKIMQQTFRESPGFVTGMLVSLTIDYKNKHELD